MWVRVVKKFKFQDMRGVVSEVVPGKMIDVLNRNDLKRLLSAGLVAERDPLIPLVPGQWGKLVAAPEFSLTKRIGVWLLTSSGYSGGRIHLYQYALSLTQLGAEVYLITNQHPKWAKDYPLEPKLKVLIEGKDKVPPDLDLIVTDSKDQIGKRALSWKQSHMHIPFVCFNFETPNWVAKFCPDYAGNLHQDRKAFLAADFLISNSHESDKHLLEWLGKDTPSGVLPPAVNDYALHKGATVATPGRPYAVYSARAPKYKGGDVAIDAVFALDTPFDLVVFGKLGTKRKDTNLHRIFSFDMHSDAEKFELMKKATVVLAPSKFEGYGMVPGEAIASGTPCIVYDLPVLRQEYGDRLIYAKWGDRADYKKVFERIIAAEKRVPDAKEAIKTYGLGSMKRRVQSLKYHAMEHPSISAHCIAYWGFAPEALESIYPHVDEIRIAYGPTALNKDVPPDGSLDLIQDFPDPEGKITLEVRDVWRDKLEMRQWGTQLISGNYHLLLDGDEIWHGLDKWIEAGFPFSAPRWVNFWHSEKHWIYDNAKNVGRRWGRLLEPYGSICPHYRWSYWRSSYRFIKHHSVVDFVDRLLNAPEKMTAERVPSAVIYHLGHMLPREIMKAKHEFYRKRDGDDGGRRRREKAWHGWKGKTGDIGDGIVQEVNWQVPDIVKRAVKRWALHSTVS